MIRWDARQYLRFEQERTQACIDLVQRIDLTAPREVVDLGCGPGNSTAVLRRRWPHSRITGVDSSPEMLERAGSSDPDTEWVELRIENWHPMNRVDLVFSNAAFQWLPHHSDLIPSLWEEVSSGGAFAFQVPARVGQRAQWMEAIRAVVQRPEWKWLDWRDPGEETVLSSADYYNLLSKDARRLDLWDTEYVHVLPDASAVVEWVKSTALRPLLSQLPRAEERSRFLSAYLEEIRNVYPSQGDGRVLFPFLRRFLVAYRA